MTISIAIVGSGPAAFYTADALIKADCQCEVDIVERLPTPYGLIRYGVAPDHEKTKNVWRAFAKTAQNEHVRFYGNVEIGRDILLDELRNMYDAVVLAVGAGSDRSTGISGEEKKGVFGSATFVNWYNGHPDFRNLNPDLNVESAVVLGNGNVAIDVARVLVKTPNEMAMTDLPEYASKSIHNSTLRDVFMVGRRGPNEAKYTNVELREMGQLENCVPQIEALQIPNAVEGDMSDRDRRLREKNLATIKEFVDRKPNEKDKRVHFLYYSQPIEIFGEKRVEGVRFEKTRVQNGRAEGIGEYFDIKCGIVIAATGYTSKPVKDAPFDHKAGIVTNVDGLVDDGLYAVGWIKRGPTGVIGSNKPDGKLAAEQILARHAINNESGIKKGGREALNALLVQREIRSISFKEWQLIEAVEITNANEGAPRKKFVTISDMLGILK